LERRPFRLLAGAFRLSAAPLASVDGLFHDDLYQAIALLRS
jgi:hypothetical protein